MQLQLIHLFLSLCIIKFLSLYTDSKFLALFVILSISIYYLYISNQINFNIKLFENVSKDKLFEEKIQRLHIITDELIIFSFNSELKQNIKLNIKDYADNLSTIYYNPIKNCTLYIDILLRQKYELLNMARSYIITSMQLETYASLEKEMLQFQELIENVLNDVTIKCPEYNKITFLPAYNYTQSHSFQQY